MGSRDKIVIHVDKPFYSRGLGVIIGMENADGDLKSYVKAPLVFEPVGENDLIVDPTIGMHHGLEFMQAALETAWRMGLRPKNWRIETTEQVAAMEAHLQDMRRLVFRDLPDDPVDLMMRGEG